jgi:uridine phosphorylase
LHTPSASTTRRNSRRANGRFFRVTGTSLGVSCLGIGPSAVTAQLENLIYLGTKRFISIGGAGGINDELEVGQPVLLTAAVRDDGVSQHYVAPSSIRVSLTAAYRRLARRAVQAL